MKVDANSKIATKNESKNLTQLLTQALDQLTLKNVESKSPTFFTRHSLKVFLASKEIPATFFEAKKNQPKIDEFLKTNFGTVCANAKVSAQLENYRAQNGPDQPVKPIKMVYDVTPPERFKQGFNINNPGDQKFDQIQNPADRTHVIDDDEDFDQ